MRQTAFSKIIQRIFGLALGTGIVLSAFPISIKGAAATDALTQRMEALPAPSAVTLQTKLQYEIESIRWAYDTLTPASLKGEISSSSLQRLGGGGGRGRHGSFAGRLKPAGCHGGHHP